MSLQSVQDYFAAKAPEIDVIVTEASSATVDMAAEAHGVEPDRIAKTLCLRVGDEVILVVAAGKSRLDNKKFRAHFGTKPKMLDHHEVETITGHPVGGVCPFGLANPLTVYCDLSIKAHTTVYPAAGATNSAVEIAPERLVDLTGARWADLCQ
ncbi:YbaK/EbsC family protein [Allorhizobium sp. BGMRC 0089]|uniref:YbaK/EbsC family protein n=1 Tax=Allorhizobium sonneratiae TaxID=2934936 RepID=UPI00203431F1|nr:YbaK/EbsC family protein [Allorhizobium sonneratiae]MCM2291666.1 YbaK/EbsC family protein [Allorhizobium sonneratiae]